MKNKDTLSAVIGSVFFGVPYLALSVPLLPALAIGTSAFVAGELVLTKNKTDKLSYKNYNLKKALEEAEKQNNHIKEMKKQIEDNELKKYMEDINNTTSKIIDGIKKQPKKLKNISNFFDYYLPMTVKIVDRYDEIENQDLSSREVDEFTSQTIDMLKAADEAFKNILNNLYREKIVDMDVEMKVFQSMLEADGLNENELALKNRAKERNEWWWKKRKLLESEFLYY